MLSQKPVVFCLSPPQYFHRTHYNICLYFHINYCFVLLIGFDGVLFLGHYFLSYLSYNSSFIYVLNFGSLLYKIRICRQSMIIYYYYYYSYISICCLTPAKYYNQ